MHTLPINIVNDCALIYLTTFLHWRETRIPTNPELEELFIDDGKLYATLNTFGHILHLKPSLAKGSTETFTLLNTIVTNEVEPEAAQLMARMLLKQLLTGNQPHV
jgi:hypothetical protein